MWFWEWSPGLPTHSMSTLLTEIIPIHYFAFLFDGSPIKNEWRKSSMPFRLFLNWKTKSKWGGKQNKI